MTHIHPNNRVSIVMPCYNAVRYVEDAVACVMNQTYPDVELIVVDDGSTDGSAETLERLVAQYAPRMTLKHQSHLGPYPARNLGLQNASGGLIAFLDADDYWTADALEKLVSALVAHAADIAYCGWQNVGEGAPGTAPYVPPDYLQMDTAAEFMRSCPWPIHAALVRREAVDAIGGFSERCFSAMDYDFWLRLYANTEKLVRVPEVLAFYRWHGDGQISRTKWKQVLDALQVRRDFVARHPEKVAHLPASKRLELTDHFLLREAYRAYWKRDLVDAHRLFRHALAQGIWRPRDLKYQLAALLPYGAFARLVGAADHARGSRASRTGARQ